MTTSPGYLLVGMRPTPEAPPDAAERGAAYLAGATAALARLGTTMKILAHGKHVHAPAAAWTYDELVIERYDSFAAIAEFWNAPEYRAVRPHRHGLLHMHFIAPVPGLPADDTTGTGAYAVAIGDHIRPTPGATTLADTDIKDIDFLEGTWPSPGRLVTEHHPTTEDATRTWSAGPPSALVAIIAAKTG